MPFVFNPITGKLDLTNVGGGNSYKDPTGVATTDNLNATYANGAAGVGATLTNAGSLAAISIDGINPALNSRVLVKNQANTYENGIYVVTTVGSGSVAWVLTRANDYNQPSEINPGDLIPISSGLVNGSTIWEQTATVLQVGVDPINFIQFTSKELSLAPYIVGDQYSDYTDIQPAITKAVMDGHDSANPCNIYVKPNDTGYTGDYVGADGINLVAFGGGVDPRGAVVNPVVISGTYTHPEDCVASLNGFRMTKSGDDAVIQQGGTLFLENVQFDLDGTNAFLFEGTQDKKLCLKNVTTRGTGSSFDTDGSAQNIRINKDSCNFNNSVASDFTFTGQVYIEANACGWEHAFNVTTTSAIVRVFDSSISTSDPFAFDFSAGTTGIFQCNNFFSNGAPLVRCQNAGMIPSMPYNVGTSLNGSSYASGQQFGGGSWLSGDTASETYSQGRTGYRGSEYNHRQAYAQTTDATVTTLFSLPLAELQSGTLKGTIIASTPDHTNTVSGDFLIGARRASGGNVTLVGAVVANINSSSAATFTCDVDTGTQTMRVRVTGVAATTYNWNTHVEWTKMLDNT